MQSRDSPAAADSTHRWRNRCNALVERWGLRWGRLLAAVSQSLGHDTCRQGFSPECVAVVPNGVPGRAAVPPAWGRQTGWTLGTMALFRPRKGLEVLLEALARLRARGLAVRLRAVGVLKPHSTKAIFGNFAPG